MDCTSNQVSALLFSFLECFINICQAIAFSEISRPLAGEPLLHHDALVKDAIEGAKGVLKELQGSVTFEEFVVQILVRYRMQIQRTWLTDKDGKTAIVDRPECHRLRAHSDQPKAFLLN